MNRDDDEISVTSTIDEVPDGEVQYNVEDVLAKEWSVYHRDLRYLIQWTGYPIHEWTWEPVEDQGESIHEIWRKRQERVKQGTCNAFDPKVWKRAIRTYLENKLEQHDKRNRKRRRLGITPSDTADIIKDNIDGLSLFPDGSIPEADTDDDDSDTPLFDLGNPRKRSLSIPATIPARPSKILKRSDTHPQPHPHQPHQQQPKTTATVPAPGDNQITARKKHQARPTPAPSNKLTGWQGGGAFGKPLKAITRPPPTGETTSPVMAPPTGVNVFAGGKEKRTRKQPDATNPERIATHFAKLQTLNKYAKRTKWKEDAEPTGQVVLHRATRTGEMLTIDTSAAAANTTLGPATAQDADTMLWSSETAEPPAGGILQRRWSSGAVLTGQRHEDDGAGPMSNSKKKTVRFRSPGSLRQVRIFEPLENHVDTDDDDDLFVGRDRLSRIMADDDTDMLVPVFDQLVTKTVTFGPDGSQDMTCVFDRITTYKHNDPWVDAFQSQEVLSFTKLCQAKALEPLYHHIRSRTVVTGHVVAHEHKDMLKNVAERLKVGSFGAVCFFGKSAILVYPSRDREWASIENLFFEGLDEDVRRTLERRDSGFDDGDVENTGLARKITKGYSETSAFLKFVAFVVNDGCQPFGTHPAEIGRLEGDLRMAEGPRVFLADLFFGMNYGKLLPQDVLTDPRKHSFFVAGQPISGQALLRSLLLWLEACNSQAQLFASQVEGHWSAFSEQPSGVVVLHEQVVPFVRQFPGFGKLLQKPPSKFKFWVICAAPERPHAEALEYNPLSIKEIFVFGDVFLLTPSFLISQPREALQFFKWFKNGYMQSNWAWGLVVPADFEEYLFSLASRPEPARSEDKWRLGTRDSGKLAHQARWELLHIVRELDSQAKKRFSYTSADWDAFPFIKIDSFVSPHDEQSLVNWFGAWSLRNPRQYRRFHVVGSKEVVAGIRSVIPIPCYLPNTQNFPDAPYAEHMRLLQHSTTTAAATTAEIPTPIVGAPNRPKINLHMLRSTVKGLEESSEGSLVLMYNRPIGYVDIYAAEKMRDMSAENLQTFGTWFKWYRPDIMRHSKKNTFTGFFMTPPEHKAAAAQARYGDYTDWNPWLALFRPGIYHHNIVKGSRMFNECELVIWDPQASARYGPGKTGIPLSALPQAQQQLIDLVDRELPTRQFDPVLGKPVLQNVWLGGFVQPEDSSSAVSPFDRAVGFARDVMNNIKYFLPLPSHTMEERGFRLVVDTTTSTAAADDAKPTLKGRDLGPPLGAATAAAAASAVVDMVDMTGGRTSGLCGIVHPPIRTDNATSKWTKCRNILFQAALIARRRRPLDETVEHKYPPTMKWWLQQKTEGRHFEHVNVDTVEEVMRLVDEVRNTR